MSDPTSLTRGQITQRRHRRRQVVTAGLLAVVSILGLTWLAAADGGPQAPTASVRQASTTAPSACAEALALADQLAPSAVRLADAGIDHAVLMHRLKLFLAGKPGGISGHVAFVRSKPQMYVFEHDAPDTLVLAKRYREVRAQCPLK